MVDALQLRDNARNQLLEIRDIESGVDYLNKVKAIEVWARAEKKDAELQNLIAEQKLRTQRILGKLIKEGQEAGEIKTQATAKSSTAKELDIIGLNKKQSSAFQQIASIPDETFEEFIAEKKQAVNDAVAELTTSGAVRLAKSLKEKEEDVLVMQDLDDEIKTNREIKELARHINLTYTKDQRKTLISLIKI